MEGPQFSTRAESLLHRQWGGKLIGMTCMPEAKLAREAEICYALLALPTDYDCWRPHDGDIDGESQFGFVMRPIPQDMAEDVILQGKLLPVKSTYFHPKLSAGLVIQSLEGEL